MRRDIKCLRGKREGMIGSSYELTKESEFQTELNPVKVCDY